MVLQTAVTVRPCAACWPRRPCAVVRGESFEVSTARGCTVPRVYPGSHRRSAWVCRHDVVLRCGVVSCGVAWRGVWCSRAAQEIQPPRTYECSRRWHPLLAGVDAVGCHESCCRALTRASLWLPWNREVHSATRSTSRVARCVRCFKSTSKLTRRRTRCRRCTRRRRTARCSAFVHHRKEV